MTALLVKIPPSLGAPVNFISRVHPSHNINFHKCETQINVGLFFDGTDNNQKRDRPRLKDSNISRLFDTYNNDMSTGYYAQYIPGVGTPFSQIGEDGESWLGQSFGIGCESRVIFGLLTVFNALHQHSFSGRYLFSPDEIAALCRNADVQEDIGQRILARLRTKEDKHLPSFGQERVVRKYLCHIASALAAKLSEGKPHIVECFADVFGFSRGAAEARVFCQWLNEMLVDGKLAGIPLRIRFVGLFDTVASAGFLSGAQAAATRSSGGHSGWAQAEFLRVPPNVENCIHMVAMHELRRNFPLDEVGHNGIMLPNCHQYAYPGSHSDVGGGYLPGELGISAGTNPLESDAMKLSQIPLNHMLECAMAAGVPMRKPVTASGKYDPFAIHPKLAQAYSDFAAAITPAPRAMSDHAQQYLNWRWQIRAHFNYSNQVKLANEADRDKLIRCNASLLADAQFLLQGLRATKGISSLLQQVAKKLTPTSILLETGKTYLYEPEAPRLLSLAQQASPTTPAVAALFDGYVHDSLAGFDHPSFEYTGYWRYRKAFLGDDSALTASNETAEAVRAVA